MNQTRLIHIGTSGWHYPHWKGSFYPVDLPSDRFLEYYVKYFQTTEINNSFYKLPEISTFEHWRKTVPESFIFSVKASRYITHMKKLKDPEQPVANLFSNIQVLKDKLGPVLFLLPPNRRIDIERLKSFLKALPEKHRYAFEFRDTSWFGKETENALAKAGAAFCIYDFAGTKSPHAVTADFVYVRLHGPDGAYKGHYDGQTLSDWAKQFLSWADEGKEIFCYFDNDEKGFAAQDALKLKELLESR